MFIVFIKEDTCILEINKIINISNTRKTWSLSCFCKKLKIGKMFIRGLRILQFLLQFEVHK